MKTHKHLNLITSLLLCCALVFTMGLISGCKGDPGTSGDAGTSGLDAAFGPGCTNCHHVSDQTIAIAEPTTVSLVTGPTVTPGVAVMMTASSAFSDGTKTVNVAGYYWEYQGGLAATINSSVLTAATLTVTLTAGQDYKAALVKEMKIPDRTMIVPVNGWAQSLAKQAKFKLWVWGDDGKVWYNVVNVTAKDNDVSTYAPVLVPGINNVPTNVPVLLNARGTGYTWSMPTRPGGSAAALSGTTIKNPYFTPDVAGQYVLNVTTTPTGTTVPVIDTLNIYAGTWAGAITGQDANGKPLAAGCSNGSCHVSGTVADKFTSWKNTGHAHILTTNIDDPAGHWGLSCAGCHSVGYNTTATNGGFDEFVDSNLVDTAKWTPGSHGEVGAWTRMLSDYPAAAKLANIQCENCHGPNVGSTLHMSDINNVRTSLAADVCGQCHGSPTHHGRFQEWQESETGHASFELAQEEGTSANCAGCHSAQGNMLWIKQLKAGNPLRSLPSASITWTTDNVQPQTCVVCHDPHDMGSTTGLETDAQPRITGDTPKLPAGFAALGVGKGAQCIICHNSRNGGIGSTAADGTTTGNSYLHEDLDPKFGAVVSTTAANYSEPHAPTQGDVLMGHNAYFMGQYDSSYRSPHANITDTCVNCHMNKSLPQVEFSDYHNSNHSFKPSLEMCTSCHGITAGLALQMQSDIEAQLEMLMTDIKGAVVTQGNEVITKNSGTILISQVTSIYGSHGAPVADVLYSNGTSTTGLSMKTLVPLDSEKHRNIAKAIWNYLLIEEDGSLGIHNPGFARDVIGNTRAKVVELK